MIPTILPRITNSNFPIRHHRVELWFCTTLPSHSFKKQNSRFLLSFSLFLVYGKTDNLLLSFKKNSTFRECSMDAMEEINRMPRRCKGNLCEKYAHFYAILGEILVLSSLSLSLPFSTTVSSSFAGFYLHRFPCQ